MSYGFANTKKLKEIGLHFGIKGSGVSQACRCVIQKIEKDKGEAQKKIVRLEKQINLSRMGESGVKS